MTTLAEMWRNLQQAGAPPPYLLLDCAGLDGGQARIPKTIFSELECLFTGDLGDELADVGPYLGRLKSFGPEVMAVVNELLTAHVGIIVVVQLGATEAAEITFSQLHRHFRKFNVVYDPQSKPLFFRYYDPRVLADVLSILQPPQLAAFFGMIQSFALGDASGNFAEYSEVGGKLIQKG